jgi:predicted CXXCH cytochrome family protein
MLKGANVHRPFADGSCNGCHRAPFGERIRLRARGERLCEACHGDLTAAAAAGGVIHAALKGERGRAGCLSCHDPHMSSASGLLHRPGPELCRECHEPIVRAAGAANGHSPAADDCLNCHLPHASDSRALLSEPAGELCRMCHDVDDEDLRGTHLGANLDAIQCESCHTPHGGEHEKLLARTLHPPVLDGCDTCHEGAADQLMEGGESPLCLMCHDDIGETAQAAEVPHMAMEVARCADCHNPHASAQASLLSAPGAAVCGECHEDQVPAEGEVAHGVIDAIGCQACHEPHGGGEPKLLRKRGDDLCLSCHDSKLLQPSADEAETVLLGRFPVSREAAESMASLRLSPDGAAGHPVPNHRVAGTPTKAELKRTETVFDGELTCLTCHDPHKGRSATILRWDAATATQACVHCHPK